MRPTSCPISSRGSSLGAVRPRYRAKSSSRRTAATRGTNQVDNVELVELNATVAGTYRIVVTSPAADQPFALVANVALGTTYSPTPPRTRAVRR